MSDELKIAMTMASALVAFIWRIRKEEKLWTPERWGYLIVSWWVFSECANYLLRKYL